MTGEMSQSEVTREAYPLHFAIADRLGGEVRAFDQYQGPYVRTKRGKFWLSAHCERCDHGHEHETGLVEVFNEWTGAKQACFPETEAVADAAEEIAA